MKKQAAQDLLDFMEQHRPAVSLSCGLVRVSWGFSPSRTAWGKTYRAALVQALAQEDCGEPCLAR